MEKEQLKKIIEREIICSDLDIDISHPTKAKEFTESLVEAIHQALSMSGVRESSLICKKCGGYFGVNINHKCFKCLEKLF
jgi:predicted esterase YcpF (UPF0227 family)